MCVCARARVRACGRACGRSGRLLNQTFAVAGALQSDGGSAEAATHTVAGKAPAAAAAAAAAAADAADKHQWISFNQSTYTEPGSGPESEASCDPLSPPPTPPLSGDGSGHVASLPAPRLRAPAFAADAAVESCGMESSADAVMLAAPGADGDVAVPVGEGGGGIDGYVKTRSRGTAEGDGHGRAWRQSAGAPESGYVACVPEFGCVV